MRKKNPSPAVRRYAPPATSPRGSGARFWSGTSKCVQREPAAPHLAPLPRGEIGTRSVPGEGLSLKSPEAATKDRRRSSHGWPLDRRLARRSAGDNRSLILLAVRPDIVGVVELVEHTGPRTLQVARAWFQ